MSINKQNSWEREIMNILIEKLEVSNGDAQGIIEAHNFELTQEWAKDSSSQVAAERLINL